MTRHTVRTIDPLAAFLYSFALSAVGLLLPGILAGFGASSVVRFFTAGTIAQLLMMLGTAPDQIEEWHAIGPDLMLLVIALTVFGGALVIAVSALLMALLYGPLTSFTGGLFRTEFQPEHLESHTISSQITDLQGGIS